MRFAVAADSVLSYRLDRAKLGRREGRYLLRTNLTACPREGGGRPRHPADRNPGRIPQARAGSATITSE
jgi:hypothetical protein